MSDPPYRVEVGGGSPTGGDRPPISSKRLREETVSIIETVPSIESGKYEFHKALQAEIRDLALEFGYNGHTEWKPPCGGSIDVVWGPRVAPVAAIEIDSSPRLKSIRKLLSARVAHRIWIYYGRKPRKLKRRLSGLDEHQRIVVLDVADQVW